VVCEEAHGSKVEGHHWWDVALEQAAGMQDHAVTTQASHKVDMLCQAAGQNGKTQEHRIHSASEQQKSTGIPVGGCCHCPALVE
jgi:hypothetical protein